MTGRIVPSKTSGTLLRKTLKVLGTTFAGFRRLELCFGTLRQRIHFGIKGNKERQNSDFEKTNLVNSQVQRDS